MPERSPLERLFSYAVTGLCLFIMIDQYDRSNGGPGVKERLQSFLPKPRKKAKTWEQLSEAERVHMERRMLIEAWNAAEGRYESR